MNITNSQTASGKQWKIVNTRHTLAEQYAQTFDLSILTANILASRNLNTNLAHFLNPDLKVLINALSQELPDLQKTITRILEAIDKKEKIGIFGDYDADGLSASAILHTLFAATGNECIVWIPSRSDGYGVSQEGLKHLLDNQITLLITVDCGSSNASLLEPLNKQIDIIVIDHHQTQHILDIFAFINPHRLDADTSESKFLCAGGLCTIVVQLLLPHLQCNTQYLQEVLYIYSALSTVCDMMPLDKHINRGFVKAGLNALSQRKHFGLTTLMDLLKFKNLTATHLGFYIGPRLNAAARMDNAQYAFKLLTTQCPIEALSLAQSLEHLNTKRKTIEQDITAQALEQAQEQTQNQTIIVLHDNWHMGVLGIVAAQVKERTNKPTIVLTLDTDGLYKGSARSTEALDIGLVLQQALQNNLIISGGGHGAAAGLSLTKEQIPAFHKYLNEKAEQMYTIPILHIDCAMSLHGLQLCNDIHKIAPFGNQFATPKILLKDVFIEKIEMKNTHYFTFVRQGGQHTKIVAFFAQNKPLGTALNLALSHMCDIVVQLNDGGDMNIIDIAIK